MESIRGIFSATNIKFLCSQGDFMNLIQSTTQLLRFKVWAKLKANLYPSFYYSHAQFGEDMIVRFLTNNKNQGFYIDIGAFHPVYLSNTYHFYCKGWQGINIDARPDSMELFKLLRPRDINLELCLSNQEGETTFYLFEQAPYNTCDPKTAEQLIAQGKIKLINTYKLQTLTITSVLEKYLPENIEIDLMNIDIEGMDEMIIMSNNWHKFQPKIIIFEKHNVSFEECLTIPIVKYLESLNYKFITKCGFSLVMAHQDYLNQI